VERLVVIAVLELGSGDSDVTHGSGLSCKRGPVRPGDTPWLVAGLVSLTAPKKSWKRTDRTGCNPARLCLPTPLKKFREQHQNRTEPRRHFTYGDFSTSRSGIACATVDS